MFPHPTKALPRDSVARVVVCLCMLLALVLLTSCQTTADNKQMSDAQNNNSAVVDLPDPASFDDMDDEEMLSAVIDLADAQVNGNDEDPFAALTRLPYGYQVIYVTWRVDSEVNSGGFYQYFHDTNVRFTFLAQRAFKQIAAPKTADLLNRALLEVENKMPELLDPDRNPTPFDSSKIVNDPLEKLDNEFFDNGENLAELRARYIRTHLAQFKAKQP